MTNTRDKLEEAGYFLERMKETQAEPDHFRYNLSAFLAAARSVTWVMKNEFNAAEGFNCWYCKCKAEWKNDTEMEFFRQIRNDNIHENPVLPRADAGASVQDPESIADNVFAGLFHPNGTEKKIEMKPTQFPPEAESGKSTVSTEWKWYFRKLPEINFDPSGEDVISLCEGYLGKLARIVSECESSFSKPVG